MKTPKFSQQLKKEIQVTTWCLGLEGIQIEYIYEGKDFTLICTKEQSTNYLQMLDMISSYEVEGDEVTVKFEFDYLERPRIAIMSYEAFALAHELNEVCALEIVASAEESKQLKAWAGLDSYTAKMGEGNSNG